MDSSQTGWRLSEIEHSYGCSSLIFMTNNYCLLEFCFKTTVHRAQYLNECASLVYHTNVCACWYVFSLSLEFHLWLWSTTVARNILLKWDGITRVSFIACSQGSSWAILTYCPCEQRVHLLGIWRLDYWLLSLILCYIMKADPTYWSLIHTVGSHSSATLTNSWKCTSTNNALLYIIWCNCICGSLHKSFATNWKFFGIFKINFLHSIPIGLDFLDLKSATFDFSRPNQVSMNLFPLFFCSSCFSTILKGFSGIF